MPKVIDKQERARELAHAAAQVFAVKGFDATRMEDVAKQAGVSKGLLYEYYRSKEDLFFEVCDRLVARVPLRPADRAAPDETLTGLIEQIAANYDWSQDFFLILADYWAKILRGNKRQRRKYLAHVESFYADRRRTFAGFVKAYQTRRELRPDVDPNVLANLVMACVEGIHMQTFLCSRGARKNEVLKLLADFVRSAR